MRSGGRRRDSTSGSFRQKVRYRFDNLLARGTWAVLVWLAIVTLVAVVLSSVLLTAFDVTFTSDESGTFQEDFWQSLLRTIDPGTMAGDIGWGRRLLALTITIFGLLVAGTLIGVMASGVEARMEQMRRGRSVVIESDHVVVLGASPSLPGLVEQLALANERTVIVVLADRDPADVYDELGDAARTGSSRVVIRSGDPTRPVDLALARLDEARVVIVLAERDDARAVKVVLAIGAALDGEPQLPIIVELHDPTLGDRLVRACGAHVHPLVVTQAVGRAAAVVMREHGLSRVIDELFDFRGCAIHVWAQPAVVGDLFADVVRRFANARPIGRMRADGTVELNPPPGCRIEPGDRLVVVAHDLDAIEPSSLPARPIDPTSLDRVDGAVRRQADERLLVVGWNVLGAHLLADWAECASIASTVDVVVDPDLVTVGDITVPGLDADRLRVTTRGSAGLTAHGTDAPPPTTVVLLGCAPDGDTEAADSRTLLDLMMLRRDLARDDSEHPMFIVQLLEADSVPLVRAGPDDFLLSEEIGSRLVAQLADQPERRAVYLALYQAEGPSLRSIPVERLELTGDVSAHDIVEAAHAAGLLAIGWRRSPARGGDLVLNPHESQTTTLAAGDSIVVIG